MSDYSDLIARLRALAENATPGPWCDRGFGSIQPEIGGSLVAVTVTKGGCLPNYAENAAYIAAINPDACLTLLDALETLQRERDELQNALSAAKADAATAWERHAMANRLGNDARHELAEARRERDEAVAALRQRSIGAERLAEELRKRGAEVEPLGAGDGRLCLITSILIEDILAAISTLTKADGA